jgi:pimeloyl-ACP methyl ester carboxylesterase
MKLKHLARYVALLAVPALAALLVSSSAARTASAHLKDDAAKPTVVLVHGAWADGSSWSRVTKRLQNDGYTVAVAANPLRGLASDSAYLAARLQTIPGPIVLVGHSYGGAVITNAARDNPNVKALVYVNAFIPRAGDTVIGLAAETPGSMLGGPPPSVFDFVPLGGDVDLYVKPGVYVDAFANDLPKAKGAMLAASQRPLTLGAANEPSGEPAWKTIPSWAVIGTRDNVIPPDEQRLMAGPDRANSKITEIKAGHLSMISHPAAVEKVIAQAADVVG